MTEAITNPNAATKVVIDEVKKTEEYWELHSTQTYADGSTRPHVTFLPPETFEYRAAEYNIPLSEIDTLVDIVVCERFLGREVYDAEEGLYNAPDIKTAREHMLTNIARVKLKHRVSTRGPDHPLNAIRRQVSTTPASMAVKGLETVLLRHMQGAQELDEHVLAVLNHFRAAIGGADTQ